jgi:hypothetical protein
MFCNVPIGQNHQGCSQEEYAAYREGEYHIQ